MSTLLEQASLVMIPSGYKEDIVYSQIPTNGNGDLSFTRASNGTRTNSAGLVEVCPWNMVQYSEDFSNAYWNKNNSPVMAYNVATAPNGTMTADSIQSNTASVYQSVGAPTLSVAPNSTVTLSIYIKKETSKTYFTGSYLYFTGGTTKLTYVLFDEVNGTINIVAPDQVSMVTSVQSVGDWWRFIVTGTDTGNNTNVDFAFYGTLSQNGTTLDTGIGSVRTIWGAQLNIGSTAKPYFPTTDRLNVPRLTYQNGGGGCPSLLLEKQSTNLALQSNAFNTSPWTTDNSSGSNPVITPNYGISPDGTQNAVRIELARTNVATSYSIIYQYPINVTIGQSYTWSVWLKSLSGTPTISIIGDFGRPPVTLTSEWVRYTGTGTATASQTQLEIAILGSNYATGNSLSADFLAYGYQIEQSSYATSLINTTSSSATRVADLSTSDTIQTAQTFAGDFTIFADFVPFIDSTDGNGLMILGGGASGLGATYQSYLWFVGSNVYLSGDGEVNIIQRSYSMVVNQRVKIAFTRVGTTVKMFVNGAQVGASNTSSLSITIRSIGWSYNLPTYQTKGKINQVVLSATGFSDADCQSLTTI
jgi:hypothetical protein